MKTVNVGYTGETRMNQWIRKSLVMFLIGGLSGFLLFAAFFLPSIVRGNSMEPGLKDGEHTLGLKSTYDICRGSIITFDAPDGNGDLYVKRVIGLSSETVLIQDGKIFVDGTVIKEPYVSSWTVDDGPYEFHVPEGEYFVLGDNRDDSYDSRYWEYPYVKEEDIRSRMLFKY